MQNPIYMKYVFSYEQFQKELFNSIDITQNRDSFLSKKKIIEILEKDKPTSGFSPDTIRFYHEPTKSFILMPETFHLEPISGLTLLLPPKNEETILLSQIQKEIKEMREENANIKGENQDLKSKLVPFNSHNF